MPGGMSGILGGGGAGTGALEGLVPDMGNPMAAPDKSTGQAEPTEPVLPLGF